MSPEQLAALVSRKPARRMAEIPPEVRDALNHGLIETKNLVEWLSVDRVQLLEYVAGDTVLQSHLSFDQNTHQTWRTLSSLKQSMAIGTFLADSISPTGKVFPILSNHPSDIVREWSAVIVGQTLEGTLKRRFAWIKPMADDPNAGLREVAWMAMRHHVAADIEQAVECLIPWTGSRSERLRRYASEVTRPRGVWTAHIARIQQSPELCLPLLEPLRADDSKYVRDSVGNWLNDASKSKPEWVRSIADRWAQESPCPQTNAVLKRGLRTLGSVEEK